LIAEPLRLGLHPRRQLNQLHRRRDAVDMPAVRRFAASQPAAGPLSANLATTGQAVPSKTVIGASFDGHLARERHAGKVRNRFPQPLAFLVRLSLSRQRGTSEEGGYNLSMIR